MVYAGGFTVGKGRNFPGKRSDDYGKASAAVKGRYKYLRITNRAAQHTLVGSKELKYTVNKVSLNFSRIISLKKCTVATATLNFFASFSTKTKGEKV